MKYNVIKTMYIVVTYYRGHTFNKLFIIDLNVSTRHNIYLQLISDLLIK